MLSGTKDAEWFGPAIEAPVCVDAEHVPVPVGERCVFCEGEILHSDRGLILDSYEIHGCERRPAHYGCIIDALFDAELTHEQGSKSEIS